MKLYREKIFIQLLITPVPSTHPTPSRTPNPHTPLISPFLLAVPPPASVPDGSYPQVYPQHSSSLWGQRLNAPLLGQFSYFGVFIALLLVSFG